MLVSIGLIALPTVIAVLCLSPRDYPLAGVVIGVFAALFATVLAAMIPDMELSVGDARALSGAVDVLRVASGVVLLGSAAWIALKACQNG